MPLLISNLAVAERACPCVIVDVSWDIVCIVYIVISVSNLTNLFSFHYRKSNFETLLPSMFYDILYFVLFLT